MELTGIFPSWAATEPALDIPAKPKPDLFYPVLSSQLQTGLLKQDFSPVTSPCVEGKKWEKVILTD